MRSVRRGDFNILFVMKRQRESEKKNGQTYNFAYLWHFCGEKNLYVRSTRI